MKSRVRAAQKRKRAIIAAAVLVALSAALVLGWQMDWFNLSFFEKIPQYTVVPVKKFVDKFGGYIGYLFEEDVDYEAELLKLQNQIKQMELQTESMDEVKKENNRLRALLGMKESGELAYTGASVIAMTPGNWFSSFTIDKGADDGLAPDMPVVTEKGLVGRIVGVSANTSVVRSIVDSQSAVAAIVEKTRDNGIVSGTLNISGSGDLMQMEYISDEATINIGDRILTSGLDGVYPKGILIGTVKAISRQMNSSSGTLVIQPSVDFKRIEEVLVVTGSAVTP